MGMKFMMGTNPVTITALGRMRLSGNSQLHSLKLVNYNSGQDVPGGTVDIDMSTGAIGQFVYANLPSPIVLQPNGNYCLISTENTSDAFYGDLNGHTPTVTGSPIANDIIAIYRSLDTLTWTFGNAGRLTARLISSMSLNGY